ncbi:MAG TPA: biliverdin-producing heme oxygenase [Kofleriaceae bacterium]|nr:biliverdin-producing heme oxygenase [Kofleriaceae bacterium]
MKDVSTALVRLNAATRQWHSAVDDSWLELLRPTVTVTDYLAQLVRTYGLVAPFESACKYTPGLARVVVDLRRVGRAGLIAQDLLELDLTPSQVASIATCPEITMFATTREALGWLYVVERTTLLADGLLRHVRSSLPQVVNATRYLEAFSNDMSYWSRFGRVIDDATVEPGAAAEIERAACEAFEAAHSWFRMSADARRTG